MSVINKSIKSINVFNFKPLLPAKMCVLYPLYRFLYRENDPVVWIKRKMCTDQAPFIRQSHSKQAVPNWRMCCYHGFKTKWKCLKDLLLTNRFSLHEMSIDGLEWITCRLLWCFYQLFGLSFWRHPFTAEHTLMSMSYVKFLQICSDEQTHIHLD